jgi:chromosome segregation ATPase
MSIINCFPCFKDDSIEPRREVDIIENGIFLDYHTLKNSYEKLKMEHYDIYNLYNNVVKFNKKLDDEKQKLIIQQKNLDEKNKKLVNRIKKLENDEKIKKTINLEEHFLKLENDNQKLQNICEKLKLENEQLVDRINKNKDISNSENYKIINHELVNKNTELNREKQELQFQLNYCKNRCENLKYNLQTHKNELQKNLVEKDFIQNDLNYYKYLNIKNKP